MNTIFSYFLTLMLRGCAHCARTFLGHLFLLKIKVLEGPNFLTFPYAYGEPPYNLLEAPNGLNGGFSAFLSSAGPIFGSENSFFLPFLRQKWQKMISQTKN